MRSRFWMRVRSAWDTTISCLIGKHHLCGATHPMDCWCDCHYRTLLDEHVHH